MTSGGATTLPFYDHNEILGLLSQIGGEPRPEPAADLQPWRSAAAVLVAFDPARLKPFGATTQGVSGLGLLPELIATTGQNSPYDGQWTLQTDARKVELRRLGSQEIIAAALAANPDRPAVLLQQMFERVIAGAPPLPPLTDLSRDELTALLVVTDWLYGIPITPPPPALNVVRATLESRQDLDRLRCLAGHFFTGRKKELERLRAHLFGSDRSILFVSGIGGAGKSALLAMSLLQLSEETHDPTCWVRVDIADSMVNPRYPISLLTQAAQQLGRRDSMLENIVASFISEAQSRRRSLDYAGLESLPRSPQDEVDWAIVRFGEIIKRYRAGNRSQAVFAFCVDTFEEAQFLGEPVANPVLNLLAQLVAATASRVIVCGRSAPPGSFLYMPPQAKTDPKLGVRLKFEPLADLAAEDALTLLERFIRQERPDARIEADNLRRVVQVVGGNPLTLQLAAHLINAKDLGALADPRALRDIRVEAAQARLYSRVLGHIHDRDVQRLAIPGLVVRLIDKHVIRDVLAGPCELGDVDAARAEQLLEALARENTLVDQVPKAEGLPEGTLRHRSDIRRVMLDSMPEEMSDRVNEIHRLAVEHWKTRTDVPAARARAEELYHRLRLGEDSEELESRWSEKLAKDLQDALRDAFGEFQPGNPARVWLAEKLGVTLDESERTTISSEAQEAQVELAATQCLAQGDAGQALAILEKQKPFQPGSRLFGLLARVLFRLGRPNDALSVTTEGLDSARAANNEAQLTDLLLLRAYVLESRHREEEALQALTQADTDKATRLARLRLKVRRRRVLRKLNVEDPGLRTEIIRLADALKSEIRQHPALLREVAAEIGDVNPTLLGQALELFGPEVTERMTSEQLLEVLAASGSFSKEELTRFAGISRRSLIELVRTKLDQLIQGGNEHAQEARQLAVTALRRSVNDVLEQSYQSAPATAGAGTVPSAPRAAAIADAVTKPYLTLPFASLTVEARKGLVEVLAQVSRETLSTIARHNLDLDLERLGGNLSDIELTAQLIAAAESYDRLTPFVQGILANVGPDTAAKVTDILNRTFNRRIPMPEELAPSTLPSAETLAASAQRIKDLLAPPSTGPTRGFESLSVGPAEATLPMPPTGSAKERARQRLRKNPADAVTRRLGRKGIASRGQDQGFEAIPRGPVEFPESSQLSDLDLALGLERIIGRNELLGVQYLDGGQKAARSIGRIVVRVSSTRAAPMGTGFLIAPGLLLTNNHVLPTPQSAAGGKVEFNYQCGLDGNLLGAVPFALDPDSFYLTSKSAELDFTLVAVRDSVDSGPKLADFGYKPLTALADEVLDGESVSIIQHPNGEPKQIALRENYVLKLPNTADRYLYYQTDTTPGSSGSPVFNDDWEVVALHHSGYAKRDQQNNILARDGRVWTANMGEDQIDWIANEGIRVVALVNFLRTVTGQDSAKQQILSSALAAGAAPKTPSAPGPAGSSGDEGKEAASQLSAPVTLVSAPLQPAPVAQSVAVATGAGFCETVLQFPMQVTVRIGTPQAGAAAVAGAALEKIEIDTDYSDREGYDPAFLGGGNRRVPLPQMTPAMVRDAAVNMEPADGLPKYVLPYHHYSVVLSTKRRLAFFTAVNIDGTLEQTLGKREQDRWIFDHRLESRLQIGNEWYGKPFDRGHLVRRLDPAWGRTKSIAKTANDDTFHFTNCSPQHARFNQGKNLWQGLENYLLDTSNKEDRRINVFTGPIFEKDDPVYEGVQVPRRFWKVVSWVRPDGSMGAAGFIVSQEDLLTAMGLEATAEQVARTFQDSISNIENLTKLDFGKLRDVDTYKRKPAPLEATEAGPKELESFEEIQL
jgi:endonuclease G